MDFLFTDIMGKPAWMWGMFLGLVLVLLVLDLAVFHRKPHEVTIRESVKLSIFYVSVALLFGAWIWYDLGAHSATEFLTGYVIEKTLSMDNIFVIALVFQYFGIPRLYQHRVLFWGILSVIVLRGIMISAGAVLVTEFHWVLNLFAAFLIFTGIKMLMPDHDEPDIGKNPVLKFLRRHLRVMPELHGEKFFIRAPHPRTGKLVLWCTPLLIALAVVEFVDVIFALDSVPAIFAITTDTYIVFTSNIFAILGLRSLYFVLAAMVHRFAYLKQAMALVLVFIGGKVLASEFLHIGKISPAVSLIVTLAILSGGVFYSLYRTRVNRQVKFKGDDR